MIPFYEAPETKNQRHYRKRKPHIGILHEQKCKKILNKLLTNRNQHYKVPLVTPMVRVQATAQVQSLAGKMRYHKPHGTAKKEKKKSPIYKMILHD